MWKLYLLIGVLLIAGCLGGCRDMGLRFAPGDEEAKSALIANDLAKASLGINPSDEAAQILANAVNPALGRTGMPSDPVDVLPVITQRAKAQKAQEQTVYALKTKNAIREATSAATTTVLAKLASSIAEKKVVRPQEVVPMIEAMTTMDSVGNSIADSVEVPKSVVMSQAEQDRIDALKAATEAVTKAASATASARPDAKDVGDRITNATQEVIDWAAENPIISALLGATPIGAFILARRRKKSDADWDAEREAEKVKAAQELELAKAKQTDASAILTAVLPALLNKQPASEK